MDDLAIPPGMATRRVVLEPLTPRDIDFLYRLVCDPVICVRWRTRGVAPSPEEFSRLLWEPGATHYVIRRSRTGESIGLVSLFRIDFRSRHAQFGLLLHPAYHKRGWPLEAAFLMLNYGFSVFGLRKIYAEMLEFNYSEIDGLATRLFDIEGRLCAHEFYGGRYWDLVVLAITKEKWDSQAARFSDAFLAPSAVDSSP